MAVVIDAITLALVVVLFFLSLNLSFEVARLVKMAEARRELVREFCDVCSCYTDWVLVKRTERGGIYRCVDCWKEREFDW